jgi:hypothetical protein
VGLGAARTANASVLALDLAVISTRDYAVIPGVVSKNTIVIFKEGEGLDADASIGKFGVNFSMNLTRSEGEAQALRNLIELASIELVGKLTKTPYWNCLGVDPGKIEIQYEVHDWYHNLVADQQVVAYFQTHLGNRGFYAGAVDGQFNAQLTEAIMAYQQGLGMPVNGNISRELFEALLNRPVPARPVEPVAAPAAASRQAALDIRLAEARAAGLTRGELFSVRVAPSQDTHVYCYFESDDGSITRFFPNRFAPDSLVTSAAPVTLPGTMPFRLYASEQGLTERIACFTSPKPLMSKLPADVKGIDFESLPVRSLEQIQAAFEQIVGNDLGGRYFEIVVP